MVTGEGIDWPVLLACMHMLAYTVLSVQCIVQYTVYISSITHFLADFYCQILSSFNIREHVEASEERRKIRQTSAGCRVKVAGKNPQMMNNSGGCELAQIRNKLHMELLTFDQKHCPCRCREN